MRELTGHPHPGVAGLQAWAQRWLDPSQPVRVAVAYSAGADSTAMLAAARLCWPESVVALHVHHGLQPAADAFETTARDVCEQWRVPLQVRRVDAQHIPGQSPEDAARQARYLGLAEMANAEGVDAVLLAQHADDQVETLWLALGRGAGLPGLAGMPERFERHGVVFGRPFLALPSRILRDWLVGEGTPFVDDPSNRDARFTRNRIRHTLMPAWQACFPSFRETVSRSMRHAAQAQALLEELATDDLAAIGVPPVIAALQAMSRARQGNVLRLWLRQQAQGAPSEAQLTELLDQIDACRTRGHRLRLKVASGWVEREGPRLAFRPA